MGNCHKKIKDPLPEHIAEKEIELLELMDIVDLSFPIFQDALKIKKLKKLSFLDLLILSAADSEGCKTVYSEDLNDSQIILGMTIVNPFLPNFR